MLSTGGTEPLPRRQLLPPAFHRDGSIYVTRADVVLAGNSLYGQRMLGYETTPGRGVNIDTPADWDLAEAMLQDNGVASIEAS